MIKKFNKKCSESVKNGEFQSKRTNESFKNKIIDEYINMNNVN